MASIRIRGARQHNLRGLDIDLPLDQIVVFAGRSGSGKSSLAFDTIHAEGQRRYLEALSARLRQTVGTLPRPDVDLVQGLPPTVALAQHATALGAGSTVGTFSEADVVLKVLFGRAGTPCDPANDEPLRITPHDLIVNELMALPAGTRLLVEAPVHRVGTSSSVLDEITRAGFSRVRVEDEVMQLEDLRGRALGADTRVRVVVDRIKVGPERRDRVHDAVRMAAVAGDGVVVAVVDEVPRVFTQRPFSFATSQALPELSPTLFRAPGPFACGVCGGTGDASGAPCAACEATGLGPMARAVRFGGWTLPQVWREPLQTLSRAVAAWPETTVSSPLLAELRARLEALLDVGLGHLTLGSNAAHLSSGEGQRLRLARQLGADLSGVLFVLDEPTTGLDGAQVGALLGRLGALRDAGNGVLLVEHHPAVIQAADRVVEFGPGPGREGGQVVFDGHPSALSMADTATGRFLRGELTPERATSSGQPQIELRGATARNLAGDPIRVPRGALTAIVGPSGAGKTAVLESLACHLDAALGRGEAPDGELLGEDGLTRVLTVDDASARRSRRSMPATYTGLWDILRELLAATQEARVRGLQAATFSLNVSGGRCEGCEGLGVRRVDLGLLPSVDVSCEVCEGRRFASDVLEVRWKGRNAAELLDLSADEALPVLAGHPRLEEALRALRDVGLGYLPLGQPAHTLSGGEARRLRLARELVRAARRGAEDTVFLLDAPTAGLHPQDVQSIVALFHRLAREGATVVIATHDVSVAKAAAHVVALGPGVGARGGRVLVQGPPDACASVLDVPN